MQRSEDEKQVKALFLSLSKSVIVGSGISGICNTSLWCQVKYQQGDTLSYSGQGNLCVNTYWGGVLSDMDTVRLENRVTGQIGLNSGWTWRSVKSYMKKKIMFVWSMYIKKMKQQSEWQIKLPKMQNMVQVINIKVRSFLCKASFPAPDPPQWRIMQNNNTFSYLSSYTAGWNSPTTSLVWLTPMIHSSHSSSAKTDTLWTRG